MEEAQNIKYSIPSSVQKLFRVFEQAHNESKKEASISDKIEIGEAISKVAFFYEKFRNAIDYKEEHLLRKNAILRILKRLFVPGTDTKEIALPLIKELILGGYLKNRSVAESKIHEVGEIIDKYAALINHVYHIHARSDRKKIFNWLVALCACEIEENLAFNTTERALIDFMFNTLNEKIVLQGSHSHKDARDIQIYISILRSFVRYDQDMISYNIFRYYYQQWHEPSAQLIDAIALHIYKIKFKIELQLAHPLSERLNHLIRKYVPIFSILQQVIEENPEHAFDLIQNPEQLDKSIKAACLKKYKQVRAKLKRTSVRSIIYIFLTKMLLALILEIPYEIYFIHDKLNYMPFCINVVFHPALLFIIALIVRVPSEQNTKKITAGIKDVIYNYPNKDIKHYIKPVVKRSLLINTIFQIFYAITYVITFGVIIFILYTLHFNIVGIILFILFLSLVTFFGLKVRHRARELLVLDKRDGIISTIVNFFAVPIVRAGRFMSIKFSKINFFVFFFDAIIEAPFKLLVEVFEDWSSYIKEKKEQIYDHDWK